MTANFKIRDAAKKNHVSKTTVHGVAGVKRKVADGRLKDKTPGTSKPRSFILI
jgi:hypothetical protein